MVDTYLNKGWLQSIQSDKSPCEDIYHRLPNQPMVGIWSHSAGTPNVKKPPVSILRTKECSKHVGDMCLSSLLVSLYSGRFNYDPHAFCVSHLDGIGRMDATTRGSQNVPCLPVAQHLSPSLRVMAFLADLSGGAGGQPLSVTMR